MSDVLIQSEVDKGSFAQGFAMMQALLPEIKSFVVMVKEGLDNPTPETTANAGGMKTSTLRVVAERMEEFAANLGKLGAFIRLATNRFGPQNLEQEKKAVERILIEVQREQVEEISRFMDRNYVGTLDHERGAVVSGRYVGAIPRIRDAFSLLNESLTAAEALLGNDIKTIAPTLAEQTFGSETAYLFKASAVGAPAKPVHRVVAAPAVAVSVRPNLSPAVLALDELITTYTHLLLNDPNAVDLEYAINILRVTKTTLMALEKQVSSNLN